MELRTIYTDDVIARLELCWGEGWLSPGRSDGLALGIGEGGNGFGPNRHTVQGVTERILMRRVSPPSNSPQP